MSEGPPLSRAHKMTKEEVLAAAKDADPSPAATYDFDLLVIGGGSGGLSAAKRAADLKAKVALCDFVQPSPHGTTWGLGGTCVNVGCIPKKLMHTAALEGEMMAHMAPSYGWNALEEGQQRLDWDTLKTNVTMHIRSLNFGYTAELRKRNITYFNAYAKFLDPHTVECTDKKGVVQKVTARRIILATGGRPSVPSDIPGAVELGISSDDIFKLDHDPGKTLVVGASYVALECAGFLTGIGREATVMIRSVPLRGFDRDMADRIVSFMETHGTKFIRESIPTKLEKTDKGTILVHYQDSKTKESRTEEYNTVLFAIGRKPETTKINLQVTGVTLAPSGKIKVNALERTTAPHIYAIGDIIEGGLELTPVAIKAGRLLAERLYGEGFTVTDYQAVPTTVFTPLEYGCVGLSEEVAVERYGMVEVYHTTFKPLEWTVPHLDDNVCYMKLIVNPFDNERVLGFHILAPNAGEITQGVAVALKAGALKSHFDETIGIHPTVAEDMTTLRITKSSGENFTKSGC